MERLLPALRMWFAEREGHLRAFARNDSRVEGWFKGELIVLLEMLRAEGAILEFRREAKLLRRNGDGRHQVDFSITLPGEVSSAQMCEIKACCVSQALGTPRDVRFYFREDHVGLLKDFRKLDLIEAAEKWVLAFFYPRPDPEVWLREIQGLPLSCAHWTPVTDPREAPDDLFLSLWKAGPAGACP